MTQTIILMLKTRGKISTWNFILIGDLDGNPVQSVIYYYSFTLITKYKL